MCLVSAFREVLSFRHTLGKQFLACGVLRGAKKGVFTEHCDWCAHFTEILDSSVGSQKEPFIIGAQLQYKER